MDLINLRGNSRRYGSFTRSWGRPPWQEPPNASNLDGANYFNNTTSAINQTPTGSDIIFIGAGGNTSLSAGTLSVQKMRVGNQITGAAAFQGVGTVTVNNGAAVNLTVGGGSALASLIIGGGAASTANSGVDGTLNIDGANTVVTAQQVVQIGYGDKSTANATLNITNGGRLVVTTGNLNLGDRNGTGSGVPGHLNISGANSSLAIVDSGANADLNIGNRAASTFSLADGTVSVDNAMTVGQNDAPESSPPSPAARLRSPEGAALTLDKTRPRFELYCDRRHCRGRLGRHQGWG